MPFIKKSLFTTDELKRSNLMRLKELKNYFSDYPMHLIIDYIKRYNSVKEQ
jgi:hypothetical protein